VPRPQQLGDVLRDARHFSGGRGGDRDVVQLGEVQQLVDRGERDVDRVELIVARRRRHHPASARDYADDLERLLPEQDLPAHGIGVAEQLLRDERAEHDDRRETRLLARREETARRERPRPPDGRQLDVAAVEAREPALVAGGDVHVLVNPLGHVLDAAQPADRIGVGRRQRRRRAKSGLAVPEALTRRRVIVLLHGVVFWVEGRENHVMADG